ncbi:MAG: rhodanese-like domain-containing protein [Sphingobacteriales bacterium]|nr:rhodanese-like domain-containing protein [Sphingobacteriales bacterium]
MKKLFSITLMSILFLACTNGQTGSTKTNLSATEFAEKIKEFPNAVILDVRTPAEFSDGHLQNALNFDWYGNAFDQQIASLDKSKPVFVYCSVGGRSAEAANKMRQDGFKLVYEMDGGMMKWKEAKLPETTQ